MRGLRTAGRASRGGAPFRASWDRRSLHKRSARPTVRGAACKAAVSNPLFAAQPVRSQCQTHCLRRSRLKFFAEAFFSKRPGERSDEGEQFSV
ncbi:hypothetical protein B5F10_08560 [Anaerotruncus colihominis]|nr:hypothetical protein B5F10_08560 [Anaerotruncus colihominis]